MQSISNPGVLITRPADQLDEVSTLIEQGPARAIPFPLLDIVPIPQDSTADGKVLNSDQYQLAIFISRNAVRLGVPILMDSWHGLPQHILWLGVGRSTAAEMSRCDITGIFPELASSEGVLSMPETQGVTGKRVLIIRGEGGRELLAATLRQRGAQVDYLEVYRRKKHPWTPAQLMHLLTEERVRAAVVTSGEALQYFSELAGTASRDLTLLVPSARLMDLARQLGFDRIRLTDGADSGALASGIAKWMTEQRHGQGQ